MRRSVTAAELARVPMGVEMENGFLSLSLTCLGATRAADIHSVRMMYELIALR